MTGSSEGRPRVLISELGRQRMFVAAVNARTARYMLAAVGDPKAESPLDWDDRLYPFEKATAWLRQYLNAAIEHLEMYADIVVPTRYFEGMEVNIAPRPFFTLCRSAIESAAQAVWIMYGDGPAGRVERHLRLLYKDFDEQAKAAKAAGDTGEAGGALARRDAIAERLDGMVSPDLLKAKLNYLDMVRASAKLIERGPDELEVLWRTASAATHGKSWFVDATHETEKGEEYQPGYFRAVRTPREEVLLDVEETACHFTLSAVFRYVNGLGYDAGPLFASASEQVLRETTAKPGAEAVREELLASMRQRFARLSGEP